MQPAKKPCNKKCANISHQVSKLSRRLEALASAVNQLNQNSNAAIGNRLKAEVRSNYKSKHEPTICSSWQLIKSNHCYIAGRSPLLTQQLQCIVGHCWCYWSLLVILVIVGNIGHCLWCWSLLVAGRPSWRCDELPSPMLPRRWGLDLSFSLLFTD